MMLDKIHRKFYKLFHPAIGEIWMLHRVVQHRSEKPEQRELEVTPEWLEERIVEYRKRGYCFVPIDHLPKHGKWVCLTFDDGYRDNYTMVYPLLKRLQVPFTVYVTTGFIDSRIPMWWYPGEQLGMSVNELKELAEDPLCTIGAHTMTHAKLDELTYEDQYKEIAQSKQELERLIGREIKHFSFPHGAHNDNTLKICKQLGFATTLQSWGGPVRRGQRPDPLPRIDVLQP